MKLPAYFLIAILLIAYVGFSTPSLARNTGGVFGPVVNEGHAALQYRATFNLDTDQFAQRLHYERALNTDVMWRVVAQTRETATSDIDFDYVQGEVFWQITPDGQDFQTGLRFDGRIRDDDRPGFVGVNWMNQYRFSPDLSGRVLFLTAYEVGDNSRDGVFIQSRANLTYRAAQGVNIGAELFNSYGSTADLNRLSNQSHQIGPFATVDVAKTFSVFAGALFGMTEASPDAELRLWLTKTF